MITKSFLQNAIELSDGADAETWHSEMSSDALRRPHARPNNLPGTGRFAAVLMLVFLGTDEANPEIVFTRRPDSLRNHPGQISFPGGQQENNETPRETAVRETHEEIGVAPERIEVLGSLNNVYIPPSDFTVTPFVGWTAERPNFLLQESEVAEAIEIPLSYLLEPNSRGHTAVESSNGHREVPCFQYEGHKIWGATAIMLDDLLRRLTGRD